MWRDLLATFVVTPCSILVVWAVMDASLTLVHWLRGDREFPEVEARRVALAVIAEGNQR
jgi:hypothetical protein